jgi:hypothetical protein
MLMASNYQTKNSTITSMMLAKLPFSKPVKINWKKKGYQDGQKVAAIDFKGNMNFIVQQCNEAKKTGKEEDYFEGLCNGFSDGSVQAQEITRRRGYAAGLGIFQFNQGKFGLDDYLRNTYSKAFYAGKVDQVAILREWANINKNSKKYNFYPMPCNRAFQSLKKYGPDCFDKGTNTVFTFYNQRYKDRQIKSMTFPYSTEYLLNKQPTSVIRHKNTHTPKPFFQGY